MQPDRELAESPRKLIDGRQWRLDQQAVLDPARIGRTSACRPVAPAGGVDLMLQGLVAEPVLRIREQHGTGIGRGQHRQGQSLRLRCLPVQCIQPTAFDADLVEG